jgi:hypothetical protein
LACFGIDVLEVRYSEISASTTLTFTLFSSLSFEKGWEEFVMTGIIYQECGLLRDQYPNRGFLTWTIIYLISPTAFLRLPWCTRRVQTCVRWPPISPHCETGSKEQGHGPYGRGNGILYYIPPLSVFIWSNPSPCFYQFLRLREHAISNLAIQKTLSECNLLHRQTALIFVAGHAKYKPQRWSLA